MGPRRLSDWISPQQRRLWRRALLAGLVIAAVAAPSALAAQLSLQRAISAIKNHAYDLTISTNADHFGVSGCFRLNTRRVACHVTFYGIPTSGVSVDCSFYSQAFLIGRSHKIHLGDTTPRCRPA